MKDTVIDRLDLGFLDKIAIGFITLFTQVSLHGIIIIIITSIVSLLDNDKGKIPLYGISLIVVVILYYINRIASEEIMLEVALTQVKKSKTYYSEEQRKESEIKSSKFKTTCLDVKKLAYMVMYNMKKDWLAFWTSLLFIPTSPITYAYMKDIPLLKTIYPNDTDKNLSKRASMLVKNISKLWLHSFSLFIIQIMFPATFFVAFYVSLQGYMTSKAFYIIVMSTLLLSLVICTYITFIETAERCERIAIFKFKEEDIYTTTKENPKVVRNIKGIFKQMKDGF